MNLRTWVMNVAALVAALALAACGGGRRAPVGPGLDSRIVGTEICIMPG
jgi:hypothetical protein